MSVLAKGLKGANLRSNAVVRVQHAGNTVKSETVELVLLHPETQITEQEAQNLMMTIVEQPAVPQLMSSLYALVEVEVVATIEHVQAIEHILGRVAVNHI